MGSTRTNVILPRRRASVLGVLVDQVDRAGAASMLRRFLRDGGRHQVVTVNIDFLKLADRDPSYRAVLNSADLAVADGMPLVWLSRLARVPLPERVAGLDLIQDLGRIAAREGVPVFLLGAGPGVAEAAARALVARHPSLCIAGTHTPPFGPRTREGDERIVAALRDAGRCVLLVAFGAPRQDVFIHQYLPDLDVPIAIGVGCAFDILAGRVARAPGWMQRAGLEWIWRLAQEPGRLWRRYLLEDLPLLARLVTSLFRDEHAVDRR